MLLALVEAGINRENVYPIVQRNAHSAWNTEGGNFQANLLADPEVTSVLSAGELDTCFSTDLHRAQLGVIWARLGLDD